MRAAFLTWSSFSLKLKSMISLYKKRGFKKPAAQARQYMRGYNDAKKFKIK